jgi:hypothetical protein
MNLPSSAGVLLLAFCVNGCAVASVAGAAASVASSAVSVGAAVVGTTADVAAAGVHAVVKTVTPE